GQGRLFLVAVLALPLLLAALPSRRCIAALETGRGFIEAAAPIGIVAAGAAERAFGLAHLQMCLGQLIDEAGPRRLLPKPASASILRKTDLHLLAGPRGADGGRPPV